ncbi:MAG: hypothetical protein P8Y71_21705 [Pseudolabrys sp.]
MLALLLEHLGVNFPDEIGEIRGQFLLGVETHAAGRLAHAIINIVVPPRPALRGDVAVADLLRFGLGGKQDAELAVRLKGALGGGSRRRQRGQGDDGAGGERSEGADAAGGGSFGHGVPLEFLLLPRWTPARAAFTHDTAIEGRAVSPLDKRSKPRGALPQAKWARESSLFSAWLARKSAVAAAGIGAL